MVKITLSKRNERNMVELVVQGIGKWRGGVGGAGDREMAWWSWPWGG